MTFPYLLTSLLHQYDLGKDISLLYSQLKVFFPEVYCAKPKSSRNSSIEAFVVCRGYAPPPAFRPAFLTALLSGAEAAERGAAYDEDPAMRRAIPFLACGDLHGWDADQNYDLTDGPCGGYVPLQPVQPPTEPAYKTALEMRRQAAAGAGAAGAGAGAGMAAGAAAAGSSAQGATRGAAS